MEFIKSAYAQGITNPVIGQAGLAAGEVTLGKIIGAVVGLLLIVAFLLTLIYLILGALRWITSGGDKNQLETAHNQITQAIVGLIIVAATWAIMLLLGSFLGLGFPNFTLPIITNSGSTTQVRCSRTCPGNTYCIPDINGGDCVADRLRNTQPNPPITITYSCVASNHECSANGGTPTSVKLCQPNCITGQVCCVFN